MKRAFLLSCAFIISIYNYAQLGPITDAPTPNASELARYGNIPVSYYTGKPNITIPICNWNIKGVKMPVNLTYDATGVPMNSLPGWLGHNWSVQAGGVITRTINGQPDEYVYPAGAHLSRPFHNYFHAYGYLKNAMNQSNYIEAIEDSIYNYNSYSDYSPDVFSFNFMGKNGRFFLGNDGLWKVQSDENIEVVFDINDDNNYMRPFIDHFPYSATDMQPKTIKGFMLRDENGTKYYFGGDTNTIEYSLNFAGMGDRERVYPWLANSWYLKKVEDRHGNRLFTLYYGRGKFQIQFYNYFYYHVFSNYRDGIIHVGDSYSSTNSDFPFSIIFNSPVYLGSIEGSDGKSVSFDSSNLKLPLRDIYPGLFQNIYTVYDKLDMFVNNWYYQKYYYLQTDDSQIRQYQYKPDSCNLDVHPLEATCLRKLDGISLIGFSDARDYLFEYSFAGRMHLTGIELSSWEDPDDDDYSIEQARYEFVYNQYNQLSSDYQTTRTDAWGFYSQIDNIVNYGYGTYTLRNVDPVSSQYGMLTAIIYPTGGRSVFEYEQNDYSKCMSLDRQTALSQSGYAGGLRIKSITEYEGQNILSRRTFTYIDPNTGVSSGQLFAAPKNFWNDWDIVYDDGAHSHVNLFQTSSIIPLSNSFGPHIGYSYVKETQFDGSYTIYHYTNIADFPDQTAILKYNTPNNNYNPTPYDRYSECGYKRGKLLDCKTYSSSGEIKLKNEYTYGGDSQSTQYVLSSNLFKENFSISSPAGFFHINGGVFKLYYSKYDLASSVTTTYFENSRKIIDNTYYSKSNVILPVTTGSYQNMVDVRILMAKTITRNGASHVTLYKYPFDIGTSLEQRLSNEQFCLAPLLISESINGTTTKKQRTNYALMQNMILPNNVVEYTGNSINADTLISYYAYNQYAAPTLYRKKGEPFTQLIWEGNGNYIKKMFMGGQLLKEYEYDYDHNITAIMHPNGYIYYYEYDPMGRLKNVRDKNGKLLKKYTYNYKNK